MTGDEDKRHKPEAAFETAGWEPPLEHSEPAPCDLCNRLTEEPASLPWTQADGSKGVDHACELCRAVLEVAQGLTDNRVKDEGQRRKRDHNDGGSCGQCRAIVDRDRTSVI
jgi:hypothetical protein